MKERRLDDLKKIYAGAPGAEELLRRHGIEYVVVGPLERAELRQYGGQLNEPFFQRLTYVGEIGAYRLYKTTRP